VEIVLFAKRVDNKQYLGEREVKAAMTATAEGAASAAELESPPPAGSARGDYHTASSQGTCQCSNCSQDE